MIPRRWKNCLLGLVLGTTLLGQDQPYRIKVNVALVQVDVIVQDRSGRVVTDLDQSNFEIYEDGQRQDIAVFTTTETPRSLLLLFDVSGSTDAQRPFMVQAFNVSIVQLRPQDRVAVASFAGGFQMLLNWRNVQGKPENIALPAPGFASNVYRSIEDGLATFKNEKGRKGMIVMTDGRDTGFFNEALGSRNFPEADADKSFQKLLQNVRKYGVPLYIIGLNTDLNRDFSTYDREYMGVMQASGAPAAGRYLTQVRIRMERLAEATGGRILYPHSLQEVAPLYEAIGRDLGVSYGLGYAPQKTPDGTTRKIEVRVVKRGDVKVAQSRDSYTSN